MNERRKLICVWKRAIVKSQHVRKLFRGEKQRRSASINRRRSRKAFALITMFAAIDNNFRLLVQKSTADRHKCGSVESTFTFLGYFFKFSSLEATFSFASTCAHALFVCCFDTHSQHYENNFCSLLSFEFLFIKHCSFQLNTYFLHRL